MTQNGIHHVTAIAGQARRNLDFYSRTLGLRLVKKTVNFDDPGAFHFYFGDAEGTPGTILTFFPWENAPSGTPGAGEAQETMFRIPRNAIEYWSTRLAGHGAARHERFGNPVLSFRDPDGLPLAMVGLPGIGSEPAWDNGDIPAEHAVRGLYGISLMLNDPSRTGALIADIFGFAAAGQDAGTHRYQVSNATIGGVLELRGASGAAPARLGRGSVHHLAFRAPDDAAQAEMVQKLARNHAIHTTEQKDREYFRSVYFREPGGVLFEIATDGPGFAIDEDPSRLGTGLMLPKALQPHRSAIEAALPALT